MYSHRVEKSSRCNQKMEGHYHKTQRGGHRVLPYRTLLHVCVPHGSQKMPQLIKLEGIPFQLECGGRGGGEGDELRTVLK